MQAKKQAPTQQLLFLSTFAYYLLQCWTDLQTTPNELH